MDLFAGGRVQFTNLKTPEHPEYRPLGQDGQPLPDALSNAEMLAEARRFLDYAKGSGRRGTPHTL